MWCVYIVTPVKFTVRATDNALRTIQQYMDCEREWRISQFSNFPSIGEIMLQYPNARDSGLFLLEAIDDDSIYYVAAFKSLHSESTSELCKHARLRGRMIDADDVDMILYSQDANI